MAGSIHDRNGSGSVDFLLLQLTLRYVNASVNFVLFHKGIQHDIVLSTKVLTVDTKLLVLKG